MAVQIVRYRDGDKTFWGRLDAEAPTRASDQITVDPIITRCTTTAALIDELEVGRSIATANSTRISATQILSPVTNDSTLLCQGLNYSDHAAEAQQHVRRSNLIFSKASSSLTGPYAKVVRPAEVELLDYEVEIGIVLRTDLLVATDVTNSNVGDIVAGFVLCNDVSARDTMFGATFLQWFQGKSYRTFCPAGPTLYWLDRDEVADTLANLQIKLWLNGELRQSASSGQMIYKPAETLSYISSQIDMKRGDMLLTGTPGGVTAPATPKLVDILKTHLMADSDRKQALRSEMVKSRPFMKPGDVMTATLVDVRRNLSLGGQENTIDAAGGAHLEQGVGQERSAPTVGTPT